MSYSGAAATVADSALKEFSKNGLKPNASQEKVGIEIAQKVSQKLQYNIQPFLYETDYYNLTLFL
jgi:hypothetical protein